VKASIVFLSNDSLALYFEQQISETAQPPYSFKVLTFDASGKLMGQLAFLGDGKSLDITSGPNETILLRESEKLDIYDARLQLIKTHPLPSTTLGMKFDRALNQLVLVTTVDDSGKQKAHFLDANSFEELTSLIYPKRSTVIFGERQLAYSLGGYCKGALHFQPDQSNWQKLQDRQTCNPLTFIGRDAIAYALNQQLSVVDRNGNELFSGHIPAPDTFHMPSFVGLSEDRARLAIMALMKRSKFTTKAGTWPYYNEVFVYDLKPKKLLLKHAMPEGYVSALSPDGHLMATIELGTLKIVPIP